MPREFAALESSLHPHSEDNGRGPLGDFKEGHVHRFTITTRQVYRWTLITTLVSFAGLYGLWVALYGWRLGPRHPIEGFPTLRVLGSVALALSLMALHELIHFASFRLSGVPKGLATIRFSPKSLLAYVQLHAPLEIVRFRWGVVLPGLLTGLLPAAVALVIGNGTLLVGSAAMLAATGGDVAVLWATRSYGPGTRVLGDADFASTEEARRSEG